MSEKLILDVIAQPYAGKTTVCDHLQNEWGFDVIRPSKIISLYAGWKGFELNSRSDYLACHRSLRMEEPNCFIEPALSFSFDKIAYDGLRVPADINALRASEKVGRVAIIAILCPDELRHERSELERKHLGLPSRTLGEFITAERAEYENTDPTTASVRTIMGMADHYIRNVDISKDQLYTRVNTTLMAIETGRQM